MAGLTTKMLRAAKLDVNLYEEVEADPKMMGQAIAVVVMSSLAYGIGSIGYIGISGVLIGTITALVTWYIWAFLTYLIGTKLLPEAQTSADHGELLRTIAFASSPGVIRILGIIPGLYGIVNIIAAIWMLIAMVIAVRQALDYSSTLRAIGVCIIGWVIQAIVSVLINMLFGFSF
jgi:hypothetical protein